MFDFLTSKWWVVALRGLLGIVFGIVALVFGGAGMLVAYFASGISKMLPPAVLLGITLPILTAAVCGRDRSVSREGIWLYAVNTLGLDASEARHGGIVKKCGLFSCSWVYEKPEV